MEETQQLLSGKGLVHCSMVRSNATLLYQIQGFDSSSAPLSRSQSCFPREAKKCHASIEGADSMVPVLWSDSTRKDKTDNIPWFNAAKVIFEVTYWPFIRYRGTPKAILPSIYLTSFGRLNSSFSPASHLIIQVWADIILSRLLFAQLVSIQNNLFLKIVWSWKWWVKLFFHETFQ